MNTDRLPQPRGVEPPPEPATATVVSFPASANARRFRRPDAEAPRGAILLFTGIRYERMPEADAVAPRLRRRS